MCLVEIPFFTEEFPCRLGLIGDNLGLRKLLLHLGDLVSEPSVLVFNVGYEADVIVVEGPFLLELVPLLLEHIQSFSHTKLLQEVPYEVINDDVALEHFRLGLGFIGLHRGHVSGTTGRLCLLLEHFHGGLRFKGLEIIQIILVLLVFFR